VVNLKFSSSYEVQLLKSLPAYSCKPLQLLEKQTLKTKRNFIIHFLLCFSMASCIRNRNADEKPAPLFPQPQSVELNISGGYVISPITGDSIQPIIIASGDTLITGAPIPAKGKTINPDSVALPKVVSYTPSDSSNNVHPNRIKIPENLTDIPLNKDSLTSIFLGEIAEDDTLHYLINSTGDTLKTGVAFPVKGKSVPTIQPQPKRALPPGFRDAAIFNLQYLDIDQGMASSYVFSILEDKNGNLWFGTYGGGVSRYDGESFTHFTEKEGLNNNPVRSILEDKNGNLWFGTYGGGVCRYDGESFTHFTEKEGLSSNTIWSILEDKNGNLWFGSDGGGVSRYDGESFTHFTEKEGLSNNNVRSIVEDKNGNLWFGTRGGGVSRYDGESFTHFTEKEGLSSNTIWSILEDKNGTLWFGSDGGGVSRYDGESFIHFTEKEGLSNNTVRSILEDNKGNLWFGTDGGGVSRYDGKSFTHFTEKEGLSNNKVWSIVEDNKGNLWFGTFGGGVCRYDDESFSHFTEKEGLSNNTVRSILEDNKGNLWFGTDGGGVSRYDGKSFTHFTQKEGLSSNTIWSILEDKNGNLWFGTYGGGVSRYDGESFTHFTEKEGLSNNTVRSIVEDNKGNLWFGTHGGGVSRYDGKSFTHFTEKEGLSNNTVWSILEDKNGNLWFGTNGGGVSRYDGQFFTHFTEKEGLSNNIVFSILEDKNGNLWFGTYGGGVNRYDGEYFTHFTEKEGLSNNIVWSILEDKNGDLWMSTEKGMNFLEHKKLVNFQNNNNTRHFQVFQKNDGLKGMDFFQNSVCLDSKSRIWWGSGKCLTMLDLNKYQSAQNPPTVYLKQLDINEQYIDYRNITYNSLGNEIEFNEVKQFDNYPLKLELPYDKNHLTFHFAAIDWSAPHNIQYSYIMEGLNITWSHPTSEPIADYRNLPFGTYCFKLRAIGESGEWSEPFEYTFTIHPPWWHTWWVRTGYSVLAVLLVFSFVRWRTAKLQQRQRELETEVANATKHIIEQKEAVEEAHKEIKDSINYAKRIQSAILPAQKLVKQYLPQSFVLYKPKDVVAGDFYWMEHKDGKVLFAAADCTGHGVPGAMVSVVCNNGLNRSVHEHGLTDPAQILNKTREIVIKEFEKSEEDVKDGMDIALCLLQGSSLSYAGANNPLWIIRKDAEEIEVIKADKQPIGRYREAKPFTSHQVELNSGDTIYIFSDGFPDQFGGEKGKKFKASNFKRLLLSIKDESIDKQQELIGEAFEEWKGSLEQVDDVCVIGVKI
jgi:ligand-binding sensor domain-containing protein/serine phosphatase RsbU (regulator of sigma subunit)